MKISENLLTEISNNIFSSDELELEGPEINYEDFFKLVNAIKLNKHIKKISLRYIESIDEESLKLLASLDNLEEIIAIDICINDLGAKILLKSKARVLHLGLNALTDACLEGIEDNKTLIELSLAANIITNKGVVMIAKNETIRTLNLVQCQIDDGCAAPLAAMKSLERLNVSNNQITDVAYSYYVDQRLLRCRSLSHLKSFL